MLFIAKNEKEEYSIILLPEGYTGGITYDKNTECFGIDNDVYDYRVLPVNNNIAEALLKFNDIENLMTPLVPMQIEDDSFLEIYFYTPENIEDINSHENHEDCSESINPLCNHNNKPKQLFKSVLE